MGVAWCTGGSRGDKGATDWSFRWGILSAWALSGGGRSRGLGEVWGGDHWMRVGGCGEETVELGIDLGLGLHVQGLRGLQLTGWGREKGWAGVEGRWGLNWGIGCLVR